LLFRIASIRSILPSEFMPKTNERPKVSNWAKHNHKYCEKTFSCLKRYKCGDGWKFWN
jgi:hypothetical protein